MPKSTTKHLTIALLLFSLNQPTSSSLSHDDSGNVVAGTQDEIQTDPIDTNDETITKTSPLHTPPTHFHITSHIQTNLATGISYFLPPEALYKSYANIPFLECGAVGSTTQGVPLVSGVFRHVPNCGVVDKKRDVSILLEDDIESGVDENDDVDKIEIGLDGEQFQESSENDDEQSSSKHYPKRPSPPRYVVALSPFEITVGGNGNQTKVFDAGDVIFMEDSWWGIWNENDIDTEEKTDEMKGYVMRAHPDSKQDLNVMMLTVPPSVHRHWKNTHQHSLREENDDVSSQSTSSARAASKASRHQPWWKLNIHKQTLPKPCSLESDPAYAHPSESSTTLAQHFTQHFVKLLQGGPMASPHHNFLPHHDLLPALAQAVAGVVGGATSFGLALQLSKMVPSHVALGFGAACVVVLGTWGIVWLGEEILDEWELWLGRRRLEKRWSKKSGRKSLSEEEKEEMT